LKLIVNKQLNRRLIDWAVPLAIAACCLALGLAGEAARTWGRYHREALEAGELWRALTGHLVHLGWGHLWLNLVALLLIASLFDSLLSWQEWLVATIVAAIGIDVGLYLWDAQVVWYVGLSGVLHAIVAVGAVKLLSQRAAFGAVLLLGLVIKLVWEQLSGPMPFSESASGGPVVVAAHLYGAASGAGVAGLVAIIRRRRIRRHDL
jgi:rhomboid family GlyGly-CTERM serine protease